MQSCGNRQPKFAIPVYCGAYGTPDFRARITGQAAWIPFFGRSKGVDQILESVFRCHCYPVLNYCLACIYLSRIIALYFARVFI